MAKKGSTSRRASGAEEASEVAAQSPPDVLVVDWMLEGSEDGLQVAQAIGQLNPKLQTVLITGYPSLALENRVEQLPTVRFLTKPFTPSHLVGLVRKAAGLE